MNGETFWLGIYIGAFVLSTVAVIQIITRIWLLIQNRFKKPEPVVTRVYRLIIKSFKKAA